MSNHNRVRITHVTIALASLLSGSANAACAVHDHNCYHSSEPFNPSLEPITTGTGDLTITSTWQGEADVNLHTTIPDDVDEFGNPIYGPFLSSNPDGNPVTASPFGTDPNVVSHDQQTVQFSSATANANLTSDGQGPAPVGSTLTREEELIISGNVPPGDYELALHSYDIRDVPDSATVTTTASAGQDGYFVDEGVASAAQIAAGHNPSSSAAGTTTELNFSHTLNPGEVSATETLSYRYDGFDQHANGVYVIPDGVWNLHGVDPQQLYQFATPDMSEGVIISGGERYDANPFTMETVQTAGYEEYLFDSTSGLFFQYGQQDGSFTPHGGIRDNRLTRVVNNPNELTVLTAALVSPSQIIDSYGLDGLDKNTRGHVKDYSQNRYNQAREVLGCSDCSEQSLLEKSTEIGTGKNTYGLSQQDQQRFLEYTAQAYSSAALYRDLKDQYRAEQYGGLAGNLGIGCTSDGCEIRAGLGTPDNGGIFIGNGELPGLYAGTYDGTPEGFLEWPEAYLTPPEPITFSLPGSELEEPRENPADPIAGIDDEGQNNGTSGCNSEAPCNIATGGKFQSEIDIATPRLRLERHYNSVAQTDVGFGNGWSSNLLRELEVSEDKEVILVVQPDGKKDPWKKTSNGWHGEADSLLILTEDQSGFLVSYKSGIKERYGHHYKLVSITDSIGRVTRYSYDSEDKLVKITEPYGLSLSVNYGANGRVATITTPSNDVYRYGYDELGNLISVTYPNYTPNNDVQSIRHYHYENINYPTHLTGITDENGQRWSKASYNADGKVEASGLVQTTNRVAQKESSFKYKGNQTIVTDANGNQEKWIFKNILGQKKLVSKTNLADKKGIFAQYDERGNQVLMTDAEGRQIRYVYNDHNQLIATIENPKGRQQRITQFEYLNQSSTLITKITKPSVVTGLVKTTQLSYTDEQQIKSTEISGYTPNSIPISRKVTMQYNKNGQLIAIDGARTDINDVTKINYYQCNTPRHCGQIKSITNALGQSIDYLEYDNMGRVKKTRDANGVVTSYEYNPRGWLLSQTRTTSSGDSRIIRYKYDNAGQLLKQIFPDGISLTMTYDQAHDLHSVTDNLGNRVEYDYDANGNRIETSLIGVNGDTERNSITHYDIRNRVKAMEEGESLTQIVTDAAGQLRKITDPNQNPTTIHNYDELGRLTKSLDALGQQTLYDYNMADQLIGVQSTNGATSRFTYDDLGNQLMEVSPDRGIIEYTHDVSGNVIKSRGARNIEVTYQYDALNRLVNVSYPDASEFARFTYDVGENCQIGTLCVAINESVKTSYEYDQWGNITQQIKRMDGYVNTTEYAYDIGNRVIQMIYPKGKRVQFKRDELGRTIKAIQNGESVVSRRVYRADGRFKEQVFGNGLKEARQYDVQGRLISQYFESDTLGENAEIPQAIDYQYDANGNVLKKHKQTYDYDPLDRLVKDDTLQYHYDGNDNRIQSVGDNDRLQLMYYSNSNQLFSINDIQIEHDPAGNQLNDTNGNQYHYNQAGKLVRVTNQGSVIAEYSYNAFSQRVKKIVNGGSIYFNYDLAGQLIQESMKNSEIASYLWIDGQPLAQHNGANSAYLISDHLNTPRIALDRNQQTVWHWAGDGFGAIEPANDPDGNGVEVQINLRFPGQYADAETGLYYNWHRYYNPKTGRYITSDPIGLLAGINTYGYVNGNPVVTYDLTGLVIVVSGSDADRALVDSHLNSLSANSPSARAMISTLRNQNEVITIVVRDSFVDDLLLLTGQSGSSYNPNSNTINYFPTQGVDEFGIPNEIALGHELVHSYHDIIFGRNSNNTDRSTLQSWTINGITGGGSSVSFGGACYPDYSENGIRSDYGIDNRG